MSYDSKLYESEDEEIQKEQEKSEIKETKQHMVLLVEEKVRVQELIQ